MKVILLQELKGRGGEGDVVEVAKGFANNYLFPKKIAIEATKGNLKQLEMRKHNIARRETARLDDAGKIKELIESTAVKVFAKVGEEGQLFGSITSQMIVEGLREATGFELDKKRIDLKAPIKTAGEHEVLVSLYRDIKTTLKLLVCDENQEAADAEAPTEAEAAEALEAEAAGTPEAAPEAPEAVPGAPEAAAEAAPEAAPEAEDAEEAL
ncbi:MAG: 50S ribosomal protein L9 [Eggerthellaceae bacterium]|jgi:large subunit ribosomal protein L9|nr:50S ribosomal protein L9 [Eggerthellaceae bacterium]MDR2716023.1 50S ribosomal protein L9 [Coriobacteriaceae bacterium]